MNNIEMLEEFIEKNIKSRLRTELNANELQAIENLIKENKELKEKAKNTMKLIGANYIHKDKVKEKIEVLKMNADYDWIYKYDYKDVIKMLQELLEEGE